MTPFAKYQAFYSQEQHGLIAARSIKPGKGSFQILYSAS